MGRLTAACTTGVRRDAAVQRGEGEFEEAASLFSFDSEALASAAHPKTELGQGVEGLEEVRGEDHARGTTPLVARLHCSCAVRQLTKQIIFKGQL